MATRKPRKKKSSNPKTNWFLRVSETVYTMSNQTQDTVHEAWQNLEEERKREIMSIPLIAFSLICFLALFSYSALDLSTYSSTDGQVHQIHNWIGMPGAMLSHWIILLFGASGYCIPALLILWGIDRIRQGAKSPIRKLRIIGCICLLISGSSLMGLLTEMLNSSVDGERIWQVCGAIGFILSRRLLDFGNAGALITNITLLAISALVCTPFLFTNFFRRISEFLFSSRGNQEDMDVWEEDDAEIEDPFWEPDPPGLESDEFRLKPLREAEESCSLPPAITTHSDNWDFEPLQDNDGGLPPLDVDKKHPLDVNNIIEVEIPDADITQLDDISEPKIVTQEVETEKEIDLGVNLVETPSNDDYQLPPITLLEKPAQSRPEVAREEIIYNSKMLEQTLSDFNIPVKVVEVNYGPTITCYELEPAPGIKISRIENLANDITRSLKAENVRIVAPIPGKGTVGVEVPNQHRSDVLLREMIACDKYHKKKSKLKVGLGKKISGEPFVFDLIKAPHILVAGATGSGKSVCINTIITSILYNAAPHEVKLLMVDPKQVELAIYRDIPHLLSPVVTDPMKAGAALRWAVEEMEQRYRYLKKAGVRNLVEFNKKRMSQQNGEKEETASSLILPGFLPYIVIIIDELADLMMVARMDVEAAISRLAAMARAVGIHLVLATQRPSVDVLTGVIKNNFPSRIAFQVSSVADSRTILDMKGAERLMGRGDMLFTPGGAGKPIRLQGAFISTEECEEVTDFVKAQQKVEYVQEEFIPLDTGTGGSNGGGGDSSDELYDDAISCVLDNDAASTSLLQRRLKIGYGRAARLLDLMEENGIVGPPRGSKPREIVLNKIN
jgi:DNA segregation ATPase FtsK/SpoIIIE, S-DNA-T family